MQEHLERCESDYYEYSEAQVNEREVGDATEHRVRIPALGFLSLGSPGFLIAVAHQL